MAARKVGVARRSGSGREARGAVAHVRGNPRATSRSDPAALDEAWKTLSDRPALTEDLVGEHREAVKSAGRFGARVQTWLQGKTPEGQAEWIKAAVAANGFAFEPWATEILFVLALTREARFTEMQRLLGISSRTLSDKLQMLQKEGLVEREVFNEQPVRVEYRLTRVGARFAALATPIFCMLTRRGDPNNLS